MAPKAQNDLTAPDPLWPSTPAHTAMSPTAALFGQLLREEATKTQAMFRKRMGLTSPQSPARRRARSAKLRG